VREQGWLWRVVERIENGQGRANDMDLLDSVAGDIQGTHHLRSG
jgi:NADH-quinone oxidoreductase subunit F